MFLCHMLAALFFLKEIITQGLAIPILKGQILHLPNKLINSQFPTECLFHVDLEERTKFT